MVFNAAQMKNQYLVVKKSCIDHVLPPIILTNDRRLARQRRTFGICDGHFPSRCASISLTAVSRSLIATPSRWPRAVTRGVVSHWQPVPGNHPTGAPAGLPATLRPDRSTAPSAARGIEVDAVDGDRLGDV